MAKIIERKRGVRKISVKKRSDGAPVKECIVCGNTREQDLCNGYLDAQGNWHKVVFCQFLGSCAGLVSTFLKSSE